MPRWLPLRGVRVLAFEGAFSLPSGTRLLADLGAEVVRVGRPGGEYGSYIGVIDGIGLNKRSITIDLRTREGNAVARRLVEKADIVCNNFTPRVMKQFELDEPALRAIKPDLITLQLSGYGSPGPWQDFQAFGPSTEAAAGMNALMGTPADPPMRVGSGVFADQTSGRFAALALLDALEHLRLTGEGRSLDLSMTECIISLLGESILYAARTGQAPARTGNRDPLAAPQGVYPCAPGGPWRAAQGRASQTSNDDEWLALSVQSDAQWQALRDLLDIEALCDPALASLEGRLDNHDLIDAAIAAWTLQRAKEEAAALLQAHGVPAGPVQKASDVPFDPQYAARGAFRRVRHAEPLLGHTAHPHLTLGWRVEGRRRPALRDNRPGGADNVRVLRDWLGMPAHEVRRLERIGALVPRRPFTVTVPPNQITGTIEPDFAAKLGLPAGREAGS